MSVYVPSHVLIHTFIRVNEVDAGNCISLGAVCKEWRDALRLNKRRILETLVDRDLPLRFIEIAKGREALIALLQESHINVLALAELLRNMPRVYHQGGDTRLLAATELGRLFFSVPPPNRDIYNATTMVLSYLACYAYTLYPLRENKPYLYRWTMIPFLEYQLMAFKFAAEAAAPTLEVCKALWHSCTHLIHHVDLATDGDVKHIQTFKRLVEEIMRCVIEREGPA